MIQLVEIKVEETEDGLTPIAFKPVELAGNCAAILSVYPQMTFEGPYYFAFNSISFLEIRDIRIGNHSLTGNGAVAIVAETLVKDFHTEIIGKRYFGVAGPIVTPGEQLYVDVNNLYKYPRKVALTVYAKVTKASPPYRRRIQ